MYGVTYTVLSKPCQTVCTSSWKRNLQIIKMKLKWYNCTNLRCSENYTFNGCNNNTSAQTIEFCNEFQFKEAEWLAN